MIKISYAFFVCLLSLSLSVVAQDLNFNKKQDFKYKFSSTPFVYSDYIYGLNSNDQFSLYSLDGDFKYSLDEDFFSNQLFNVYFNKLYSLDKNQSLSVYDLKTQQQLLYIDDYDIKTFIVSSSYLILLTESGDIVCLDTLTGVHFWTLSMAADDITFFGQSGYVIAYKNKQLALVSLQSGQLVKNVMFKRNIEHILTTTNSYAVVKAKQTYLYSLVDSTTKRFDPFDVDQIKFWYRNKAAVGFDESISSFFLYDISVSDFVWFYQLDGSLDYFLYNDTHLCVFDTDGTVYIISLYDGQLEFLGRYNDSDDKASNFLFKDDRWFLITQTKILILEEQETSLIFIDLNYE